MLAKLDWMREQRIWPNGARYLWTDAFGVVLLVSLYHELQQNKFLDEAERVVADAILRIAMLTTISIRLPSLCASAVPDEFP